MSKDNIPKVTEIMITLSVVIIGIDDEKLSECWRKLDLWRDTQSESNSIQAQKELLKSLESLEKSVRVYDAISKRRPQKSVQINRKKESTVAAS